MTLKTTSYLLTCFKATSVPDLKVKSSCQIFTVHSCIFQTPAPPTYRSILLFEPPPNHHRHNTYQLRSVVFLGRTFNTKRWPVLAHMPLWSGLAGRRHYPLLKVDTGKSRQLDDCFRNYRSDQSGPGAQKTSWRGSEALLHASGQRN